MHDPSFLAAEIHAPIPLYSKWRSKQSASRPIVRRRTNVENLGERVYPWWKLDGYDLHVGRVSFDWPTLIEIWHDEPGGADMGEVCNYRERHQRPIRWLIEHRAHLRWKLIPYIRVRRWLFQRCEDCGRRFRWKEARFGTGWDAPGVLHEHCSSLRHKDGLIADLVNYVRGHATSTEDFRVRYQWLGGASEPWSEQQVAYWAARRVRPSADHKAA